ncbi:MAG: right-handed parallel beta-helix repeat-containing protein [Verrucomicrobia bacterium]|nr:right-handed parallel beta-helix repeat-containing protein [Verrucomicrobiota bacterium]
MKTLLGCGLIVAAAVMAQANDRQILYVAPDGNDSWSGHLPAPNTESNNGPFATIHRAQTAVRDWLAASPRPDSAPRPEIHIRGGLYLLEKPLTLTPQDSQTLIRAYRAEQPILSGGVRITGWKVGGDGRWRADLPAVREQGWNFTQLFVNDQRRPRPRLPVTGHYLIAGELAATDEALAGVDRFQFGSGEIRPEWSNLNDVEVLAFHSWTMSRLPIKSVDAQAGVVNFFGTSPSKSYWGIFKKGNRYLVENVKEALGTPGQWYLDRPQGELIYLPQPGETPDNTVIIAPRLERLLVIAGEPNGAVVRDVRIEGLTFAHAAWPIPRQGQAMPQAEINLDGAISATGAHGIVFKGCAVRHVGAYAIALGDGCHHNLIESCEMIDLGAGGVKLGAAGLDGWGGLNEARTAATPTSSHNTVRDCTIAFGGRLHPAAIGVWIGHSPHNTIEHNEIFDLYYSATSIGWVWGYAPSHAHHNRVLYNHLHTLGQGVLSDMGAVYTLGISPGTVVSHNVIHDVHAFDYGGWGLYTDEGSTGVAMENNLVYRTKTGGFHQHYGRENFIRNNILAFSQTDQLQRTRKEPHISFTFERNLVLYDRGALMGSQWADDRVVVDGNLYWNRAGDVRFPGNRPLDEWRAATGHDRHSLVADPQFLDPAKHDYRLAAGSPAFQLGFVPFDPTKAGRLTPRTLTAGLPPVPPSFEGIPAGF